MAGGCEVAVWEGEGGVDVRVGVVAFGFLWIGIGMDGKRTRYSYFEPQKITTSVPPAERHPPHPSTQPRKLPCSSAP